MKINICGSILTDWHYHEDGCHPPCIRWGRDLIHGWDGVDLVYVKDQNHWQPIFTGKLLDLRKIYNGPNSFASLEKAKNTIDEFLQRTSKLMIFW